MNSCYLLPEAQHKESISVRRSAAMGDCISATVVCDRLAEQGFNVTYACHAGFHPILRLHPKIRELKDNSFFATITLDNAYEEHLDRRTRSFSELFIESANRQLVLRHLQLSSENGTPRLLNPDAQSIAACLQAFQNYPRPWIIIVPRANGYWHGRHVPTGLWLEISRRVKGTCFWLGQDPPPSQIVDLHCQTIEMLAPLLMHADLVVSVDTGPMHLAAALGKPVVAINQSSSPELHLTDQRDFEMIGPELDCLNCQKNVCPINPNTPPCQRIDPDKVAALINERIEAVMGDSVSAVIAVYRPKSDMLNRCLGAVQPQVNEVVITVDKEGSLPPGVRLGAKTRVVTTRLSHIGVGRNYNHGFRHTHGRYILMLNDDVYIKPDAVQHLKACMKRGVGLVGQLSHYPNGTIYHAGKVRNPIGSVGHHHIDHGKHRHTITEPIEVENVNMASALFRREAFYSVRGFDERFFMYAEDDDLSMRLRRAGWQIWYTPLADAIHDEHQETKNWPNRHAIMMQSNLLFGRLWGKYYEHNKGNQGLGNFHYA